MNEPKIYMTKQYLKEVMNATRNYERLIYADWEVRYMPLVKSLKKSYPKKFGVQNRVTLEMLKLELQLRMGDLVLQLY